MINTHKLELPVFRTYFHGSKGVRAIEVLLYALSPEAMPPFIASIFLKGSVYAMGSIFNTIIE